MNTSQSNHPTKEQVRTWMNEQMHNRNKPLPSNEEIRRQLGWKMCKNNKITDLI